MKLINGLKLKGRPAEIPDCSRDDLPQFFVEMGFKVGAEIGVWQGAFSKKICQTGLKLYAIDPWLDYSQYHNMKGQEKIDQEYAQAKKALSPYPNCEIVRKTSMEAVEEFEDESLDFVYIDGNHLLKHVVEDICEWSKKVRQGGIVAGDDFFYTAREHSNIIHVPYAVKAFTDAYNVKNWYLLGRKQTLQKEKRDRWRSWMFVKDYPEPSSLVLT